MAQVITDTILAKPRTASTKGASRRLRSSGWVPAVAYGPNLKETAVLSVETKTFMQARFEFGVAHIYNVKVEGGDDIKVLLKRADRDPVSRKLTHVDFYAVDMKQPIHARVRIDLIGKAEGVVHGGLLQQTKRRMEVECLPGDLPSHLEVDISSLNIGDSIHLDEISLPKGVKATSHENPTIVLCAGAAPEEEEAVAEAPVDADAAPEATAEAEKS